MRAGKQHRLVQPIDPTATEFGRGRTDWRYHLRQPASVDLSRHGWSDYVLHQPRH